MVDSGSGRGLVDSSSSDSFLPVFETELSVVRGRGRTGGNGKR